MSTKTASLFTVFQGVEEGSDADTKTRSCCALLIQTHLQSIKGDVVVRRLGYNVAIKVICRCDLAKLTSDLHTSTGT